jgi:hypothetical protein
VVTQDPKICHRRVVGREELTVVVVVVVVVAVVEEVSFESSKKVLSTFGICGIRGRTILRDLLYTALNDINLDMSVAFNSNIFWSSS